MDGDVTEDTHRSPSPSKKMTYGDFFKEWFPFYLTCGMTYSQYWDESSDLVLYYFKAYIIARDENNFMAWLHGAYNYAAFSAVMSNFGAGLAGKRSNAEYPKEPRDIRQKTQEEIEMEREAKIQKFVKGLNRFHARMEAKNA